jgi:hypothetical protein
MNDFVTLADDGVWMILRDQGENDQEEILKGRVCVL